MLTLLWLSVNLIRQRACQGALVHAKLYGLLVSSPILAVPLKNSTLVIDPLASEAVAVIVIVAPLLKVALFAGPVTLTAGGLFEVLTTIAIDAEVVMAFLSSVAFAVIVCFLPAHCSRQNCMDW